VLRAWGFEYRQTLVWHKTGNPSPFGGTVAPNHAEFLLVAARGTPRVQARIPGSVIAAPKPYEHSRKPDVFLDLVEQVSPGPYVELFARRARFGWDYWGDQSLGTAEMAA
jgi:N6-adenosine-specific RNA methylase IME4